MPIRKIIKIDEEKCNGCGECIPNCPEGALQVIDGKVRLISDLFCDGLGACLKHCPAGAIEVEEREAGKYSEEKVMENIVKAGKNTIIAHLKHLKEHGENALLKEAMDILKKKKIAINPADLQRRDAECGCPGSKMMDMRGEKNKAKSAGIREKGVSELRQWPVQIKLVPVHALYFEDADLLLAADCVPFAYPDFHAEMLKDKVVLVGCPKLDDVDLYAEKIGQILKENKVKSLTIAHMEVPCCFGLVKIAEEAVKASGKKIAVRDVVISIKGEKLKDKF
jgi:ferredoxin